MKPHEEQIFSTCSELLKICEDFIDPNIFSINKQNEALKNANLEGFIPLPCGDFIMGDDNHKDESPSHLVTIKHKISMSKYQISTKEYMQFATQTNSNFPKWYNQDYPNIIQLSTNISMHINDQTPIFGVSWENAKAFCNWKSLKEGLRFRLPSEAEWEYACKAGSLGKYFFSNSPEELGKYAWFKDNSSFHPHPVGTKLPNPWGFYDMLGNVWEWCEDVWSENYLHASNDASANRKGDVRYRILRGGGFKDGARYVRNTNRNALELDAADIDTGFRIVFAGLL